MRTVVALLFFAHVFVSRPQSHSRPPQEGEIEAKVRCSVCHAYPEPGLLPRETWRRVVLPQMGYQMGVYPHDSVRQRLIEPGPGGARVLAAGIFPEKPQILPDDWEKIQAFYLRNAPDSLELPAHASLSTDLKLFRPRLPELRLSPPSATLVRFRPGSRGLYLGDANTKHLYWMSQDLQVEKAAKLAEGIVQVEQDSAGIYCTLMGSFSPTDAAVGMIVYLPHGSPQGQILLENLQRPIHSVWADFDGNGLQDAVVCEYAKWTGGLTLHLQQSDGAFQRVVLRNRPGAIKCYVRDFNADGHPDLIALFGQGDEGIYRYINDGKGNFSEERILRFPPTWGSSNMRLVDVNSDGYEDIVYTCGDNADYAPILKPYHGIRYYMADPKGDYPLSFFYHLPGAYDAIPGDFDQDGDLDIAALSFFPDFSQKPTAAFVYLEHVAPNTYLPSTFPEANLGRWMVLDAGDLEGDGDTDLALGPLTFEVVPDGGEVARWVRTGIPFVVLENTVK